MKMSEIYKYLSNKTKSGLPINWIFGKKLNYVAPIHTTFKSELVKLPREFNC